MSQIRRVGDLDIDEDITFQRRMWAFQRGGWLAMVALVLAAAAGAFGGTGFLSRAAVGDEVVRLEYPRLTRHGRPEEMTVHLAGGIADQDSTVTVWFERTYLDGLDVESVTPEPVEVTAGPDRVTYRFGLSDPSVPTVVSFSVQPLESFARRGRLGSAGVSHDFSQFVFP